MFLAGTNRRTQTRTLHITDAFVILILTGCHNPMIPKILNCFSVPLWRCGSSVERSICKPLFDLFQNSGMFPFHKSHLRHPSRADDHRFFFLKISPSFELKTHLMSALTW